MPAAARARVSTRRRRTAPAPPGCRPPPPWRFTHAVASATKTTKQAYFFSSRRRAKVLHLVRTSSLLSGCPKKARLSRFTACSIAETPRPLSKSPVHAESHPCSGCAAQTTSPKRHWTTSVHSMRAPKCPLGSDAETCRGVMPASFSAWRQSETPPPPWDPPRMPKMALKSSVSRRLGASTMLCSTVLRRVSAYVTGSLRRAFSARSPPSTSRLPEQAAHDTGSSPQRNRLKNWPLAFTSMFAPRLRSHCTVFRSFFATARCRQVSPAYISPR
mmetsp:Transcript_121447/g.344097  ORF Transcript_121447/g.344097 Transcript_121447/m.344097 type:complete len:273 (-) Transcript_121447:367-1185(-)